MPETPTPSVTRKAKFNLGAVVRHRIYPFRGVVFDVDPVFANTEEWWEAIPEEVRPRKDQPFYHLLAENAESEYIAYVSEQNSYPTPPARRSATPRSPRCSSADRWRVSDAVEPRELTVQKSCLQLSNSFQLNPALMLDPARGAPGSDIRHVRI